MNQNDVAFGDDFPYLAVPTSGSATAPHTAAAAGFTPLNGGSAPDLAAAVTAGVPSLAIGASGAGLLLVLGGAVLLARRPRPVVA